MIKLILLGLIFFLGYTVVQTLFRPTPKKRPDNRTLEGEEMVQDPQCGNYFPASDGISANIAGKRHYFCSKKCRNLYRKAHK